MPHYFFHFTDGHRQFTDSAGVDLAGIAAAQQHAADKIRGLRDAMPGVKLQNWLGWKIIAVDSVGNTVYEVGFDFTTQTLLETSVPQSRAAMRVPDAKVRHVVSVSKRI